MDRVLRNTGATVQITLYDSSGNAANPPAGALTADVKDSAGTAISGSPFTIANPPVTTGVLLLTLPGALNTLDTYDVTWNIPDGTKRYSQFEMVGGFLFTIAEVRAFDTVLTDTTLYPASKIVDTREQVEELFEDPVVTGVAFRPRGRRAILDGDGTDRLILPDPLPTKVVSGKIGTTALTGAEITDILVDPAGILIRDTLGSWTAGDRNVQVLYEHGFPSVPAPIRRAALKLERYILTTSALETSDRATAVFTELGGYRLTIAGRDGPTGLPDIDAALARFDYKRHVA